MNYLQIGHTVMTAKGAGVLVYHTTKRIIVRLASGTTERFSPGGVAR